jgi:uncharacterized FlaG/YvyC family protein
MNVLETLWIVIKTNSAEVKKGEQEAKLATDKLSTSLTATQKVSKDLGESFTQIATRLSEVMLAFISTDKAIEGLKSAGEYSEKLFFLSKQLGVGTEQLDAWGHAAEKSGGSIQGFQGSLTGLVNNLAAYKTLGAGPLPSILQAQLGISINDNKGKTKDPFQILREVAARFHTLPHLVNIQLGRELGFDPGTILMLEQGTQEIDKLIKRQKELGLVTSQSGATVHKFTDSWLDLGTALNIAFLKMDIQILPILGKVVDALTKVVVYLGNNTPVLTGLLSGLGLAVAASIGIAVVTFGELAIGIALIVGLLALLPAAGALVVYGFERLSKKTKEWGKDIHDAWEKAKPEVEKHIEPIEKFIAAVHKARGAVAKDIGHGIVEIWDAITAAVMKTVHAVMSAIQDIESAYFKVKNFLHGDHKTKLAMTIEPGKQAVKATANVPIVSRTTNSTSSQNSLLNKNVTVSTGAITINTLAKDAESIASNFIQTLQSEFRRTVSNFDDGVQI